MNLPLESQVTSRPISELLKELGCKQESLFYHQVDSNASTKEKVYYGIAFTKDEVFYGAKHWSAYTVAELGEMLPWLLNYEARDLIFRSDNKG